MKGHLRLRQAALWMGSAIAVSLAGLLAVHMVARANRWECAAREIPGLASLVFEEAFSDAHPLGLPQGGAHELYLWLEGRQLTEARWRYGRPRIADPVTKTFRDPWGYELVYKFPSHRKEALFDLYSVGPNHTDEDGRGDDITCGEEADFASNKLLFTNGAIDVDWVKANVGHLRRDPRDGTIIGTPQ